MSSVPSVASVPLVSSSSAVPQKVLKVGPYKLGKTLGIGSFCKVKLATHELTGQKVAIKILNRKKLKKQDMGEKVRTEIHILRLFAHPHIIRLYEVIDTPTDIFTVMEYVPGGELFDHIVARGKLEENEARALFQQIISGVEYCHVHMVCHRDLKPENLLLDAENKIKIADFGLSNRMRDGMFLKTSCGSPNYAAPEVISGNLYSGPEVDVWSCGVILFALLCGSLPFDDENIRALFRKIKGGIYTIPPHVSSGARELMSRMLVVDPLKRITMPQIMQHPWYRTNLPAYLQLSAEQQIERTQAIDDQVIQRVVNMGFAREKILRALTLGHELLTSRKMAHHVEARKVAVIYHLLRDQKRKREQQREDVIEDLKSMTMNSAAEMQNPLGLPKDSANNVYDLNIDYTRMSSVAAFTHKQLLIGSSADSHNLTGGLGLSPFFPSIPIGGRWQLSKQSQLDPQTVMNELYRALKKFNFEWKVLSLYKVKARFPAGLIDNQGKPVNSSEVCKLGIQLYRTAGSVGANSQTPLCLIDIGKLYGQQFLFLELCSHLMAEMEPIFEQFQNQSIMQ